MKLVFIDEGFEIVLDTSEIEYTLSSTIFAPLSGNWSYPFALKATEEVLEKLNFPNLQNVFSDSKKIYLVQLMDDSHLLAQGDFVLQYADDELITATLTATPGNISKKIWAKKLNTFALGSDTIPEQDISGTMYHNLATTANGTYTDAFTTDQTTLFFANALIVFKTRIELKLGTTVIVDQTIEPTFEQIRNETNFFQEVLNNYNNSQADNEFLYDNIELIGILKNSYSNNLSIKFSYYDIVNTNSVIRTIEFSIPKKTVKTITNYLNNSLQNSWTKPYFLPEIVNSKHYSQSSGFNGTINKTNAGNILRNSNLVTEKTKYSLVPMLKLKWLIESIFSEQGYTISGTFLQDVDIQKLLIFNLFTTDKTIEGLSYPINVHSSTITYANHLPDVTLVNYCQSLIDEFGLCFEFNTQTKNLDINFLADVLAENSILDLTGRLSRKRRNNHIKAKKTQVKWTLSGDSLAKDDAAPYLPVPLNSVVEANQEDFETINLQIPGLMADASQKPKIEAAAISPIFSQSQNTSPLRFVFWDNNTGKVATNTLSFDLTEQKGIFNRFLKTKTDFNDRALNLEAYALMTKTEILSFRFKQKIGGFGVMWLCEELKVRFRANQDYYQVELKLKRYLDYDTNLLNL